MTVSFARLRILCWGLPARFGLTSIEKVWFLIRPSWTATHSLIPFVARPPVAEQVAMYDLRCF